MLKADPGVRQLCVERASATAILRYALDHGLTTLRMDGWSKCLQGITTVEDVCRITKVDVV
jgi:type II secretory ATPase GspE/PulE/Tfp pilus assembly ATPase PilB-like protein